MRNGCVTLQKSPGPSYGLIIQGTGEAVPLLADTKIKIVIIMTIMVMLILLLLVVAVVTTEERLHINISKVQAFITLYSQNSSL